MFDMKQLIKHTKNLNLLYVEDNKETRESTILLLEDLFNHIIVGIDGMDGLDKFKSNPDIDLIISDINMPKMDGLEMSQEILALKPKIPIFIFSAHNESHYFVDAIKIGVEGYLLKPLDMKQFLQSLDKTVEKIQLRKENIEYKISLEHKVQLQVDQLLLQDKLLIQNSKMAAMGEMIDIIAHQWKQPLNNIAMRADFMAESIKDGDNISPDEIINCGDSVKKQVIHLVDTLNEFRGFFRPTTNIEVVDLTELIDSLKILLKDNLIKHNIELVAKFDNIKFKTNLNEFKHILINLINNAKDAFIENKISDRKIIIEAMQYDNNIVIIIEDNAGGILKNIIGDIFNQNFTTKEKSGGTGIGLYMSKIIANKYNIDIGVESIPNGSKFILNIKE